MWSWLPNKRTCRRTPLQLYAASQCGKRNENQDNFLLLQAEEGQGIAHYLKDQQPYQSAVKSWPETLIRVAVADGMGGHRGGREMAEAVMTGLLQVPPQSTAGDMRAAILNLHQCLQAQFPHKGDYSPGSTLVVADLEWRSGQGVLLNLGDSRAYCLHRGKIRQLTHDHSAAEFVWRDGELSDQDYAAHRKTANHRLAQALGYGSWGVIRDAEGYKPYRFDTRIRLDLADELPLHASDHADVISFQLAVDSVLILASDGLWNAEADGLWDGSVPPNLLSQAGADALVSSALQHGSQDNVTVVLCGYPRG